MLADKIRYHREALHLSQTALAEWMGVPYQSVVLWEGNQAKPTNEQIETLAKLFGVSKEYLQAENVPVAEPAPATVVTQPVAPKPTTVTASPEVVAPASEVEKTITQPTATTNTVAVEVKNDIQPKPIDAYSAVVKEMAEKEKEKKKNSKFKVIIGACVAVIAILLGVIFFVIPRVTKPAEDVPLTAEQIYQKISPSVVEITAESDTMTSTGTGFFYDDGGTVVTNYHVIEDCQTAIITLADGSTYDVVSVLGYDEDRDIAILSTECKNSKPLSVRTSAASTGESVYVLGSSLGLTGSLSSGIVSAVDREVEGNVYLQTTAPISSGNSGGPLVDGKGKVIGIVCASFDDGQNLNLAIPINDLKSITTDEPISLEELFPENAADVEWLSDYRFQYYDDEDVYVLLFQLSDVYEDPVSASGTVDIKVVNDYGSTVYKGTHRFSSSDFEEWYYGDEEMYLCTIYIAPEQITEGSTKNGTCYFEVSGSGFAFDECDCDIDDLPT